VEELALRWDRLEGEQIYSPLPARSDCFLQIYLADRYRVVTVATGGLHLAPRCVLVGPHTRRREDLLWTGRLRVFTIRFSPIGFRVLFGMPAQAIREYAGAADDVLGAAARELEARLDEVEDQSIDKLAQVAEQFLLRRLERQERVGGEQAALRMVSALKRSHGGMAVAELADRHGMSVRQVERMFQDQVGVSPKVFGRLARLRRAMRLGAASGLDWAEVAAAAGYYDQSHMVREFQALNGTTPMQFRVLGERAAAFRQDRGIAEGVAFVLSEQRGVPLG
jgi:AraC-like DNA-binding protein